jgi:hypothetical protein
MSRIATFVIALLALGAPLRLPAQPVDTTVCDILANPQSFDGKIVRLKAQVVAGFEQFEIKGNGCKQVPDAIWLSYPSGTNGKAGPVAFVRLRLAKNSTAEAASASRAPVTLERNKDFEAFDKLLSTPAKTNGTCLGCAKFTVTATLVGRLDGTDVTGLVRDNTGKVTALGGFGNLNRYNARLVLQSVSDVSPQEIDYSKPGAAGGNVPEFGPGSPGDLKRSVEAFGAPGEDNGVNVGFQGANEVPNDDSLRSAANSPDGLIFDVAFASERLKGPAMSVALAHIGTHIADIRDPQFQGAALDAYHSEFRAWSISVLSAIAGNVKNLILPGGYVIYSKSWPNSDVGKNASSAIAAFLDNQ